MLTDFMPWHWCLSVPINKKPFISGTIEFVSCSFCILTGETSLHFSFDFFFVS